MGLVKSVPQNTTKEDLGGIVDGESRDATHLPRWHSVGRLRGSNPINTISQVVDARDFWSQALQTQRVGDA
jgi:hypothetical protein